MNNKWSRPPVMCSLVLSVFFFWGTAAPVLAQSQVRSADLAGSIKDGSGRGIAGAHISITDQSRGITRQADTDSDGSFRIFAVPAAVYQVVAEAPSFRPNRIEELEMLVGETVEIELMLDSTDATGTPVFQVDAVTNRPAVDAQRTQQANVLDSRQIENLPINRRNYLDFARLSPGVIESADLVDDTDFRPSQSPQSGLSIGGNNGRGNSFTIDGVSNDYNSGGIRPALSQAAIQEFQVNRNSFSAEFGGASAGIVNIVSKSGTNDFHGQVFGLLRHRDIQARNYFDGEKSPFTRGQYGIAGGGALVRDRTHWFGSYERLDRHETTFVPILRDQSVFGRLMPSQQQLATFLDSTGVPEMQGLAAAMRQALITTNHPDTIQLFQSNSGNFPFGENYSQFSGRLDHTFSPRHSVFLRTNFALADSDISQFGALIGRSRGRASHQFDGTVMGNSTWVPTPHWLVETRLAFGYDNFEFKPADSYGPEIDIAGFGIFGRDNFLPSKDIERNYQAQQTVSHFRGSHIIKFGYNIVPVQDSVNQEVLMAGQFGFAQAIPLGVVLNGATGTPGFDQSLKQFLSSAGQGALVPAVDAPISALQAYNLGLPAYYQQGFGIAGWAGWVNRYNFFGSDAWRVTRHLTLDFGLRYELETKKPIFPPDHNNFAPRFGFAWSPGDGGRTVVRGGYGIFYGVVAAPFNYTADHFGNRRINTTLIPIAGLPGPINPQTGAPVSSVDIYQSLIARGVLGTRSITPADLAPLGLQVGPDSPLRVLFEVDRGFRSSYAHQASFEIERSIGEFTVSAAWNYNRTLKLPRAVDRNRVLLGRNPDGSPIVGLVDPLVLQHNYYQSTANSYYNALLLQASRRFSRHLLFNVHYTWSKTIDDVTDYAPDYEPNDQFNLRAERAVSAYHRGHRLVSAIVYESPLSAKSPGAVNKLFGDFTLSNILEASSGRPFNLLTGYDTVGDNHPNSHRPNGLGRNAGRGPAYFSTDFRLARRFPLSERLSLEFTGEMFNALNRTNFKTVNNIVGNIPLSQLPSPITGNRGAPTDPLAFTSAYDPRQFQFGLGLRW